MTVSPRPLRDHEWSAARRAAARAHHPDVGGDLDTFITFLSAIDAKHGRFTAPVGGDVVVVVRHPHWRRAGAAIRLASRRVIPSRVRYARL